jgi:hypothetical protein
MTNSRGIITQKNARNNYAIFCSFSTIQFSIQSGPSTNLRQDGSFDSAVHHLTTSQISELVEPDPRHNTNQQDDSPNNHSPKLNLQHILIVIRLRSKRNRNQHREQDHIPADAVVLVQFLRIVDSAVQRGYKVLRDSDDRLDEDEDIGDQPEDGVGGHEVRAVVADLVVLDHDEAGEGGEQRDVVEGGVRVGAFFLLLGCVGWLDDEDALDEEDEGGGVEELL